MHWFLDPITKHYADFSGRASRQEFWMFYLMSIPVMIGLFMVAGTLGFFSASGTNPIAGVFVFGVILVILSLAIIIPSLALAVRRLHDTGRSGWWILLQLVPYVGGLVLLVLYCLPSQDGTNMFGPHPYAQPQEEVIPSGSPVIAAEVAAPENQTPAPTM